MLIVSRLRKGMGPRRTFHRDLPFAPPTGRCSFSHSQHKGLTNRQTVGNNPPSLCRAFWHGRFSGLGVFIQICHLRFWHNNSWEEVGFTALAKHVQRWWFRDGSNSRRWLGGESLHSRQREMLVELDGFVDSTKPCLATRLAGMKLALEEIP
jgi:hypothetical protein